MKFLIKIIAIAFLILSLPVTNAFSQQMPNGSFETWSSGEPVDWNTSNYSLLGINWDVVTKETASPQLGTASAKLSVITKNVPFVGTITIQGALTLGVITMDPVAQTATVSGGYAFTGMPQKLTGYFKYQPVANDTCYLGWGLTKWNNGVKDTIGYVAIDTMGTFNNWTYFEIPLEYLIWEAPDTMNILFLCSNPLDGVNHTNTKMWVDNLSFVYGTVSIEGLTFDNKIKIYGQHDSQKLILEPAFDKPKQVLIELISISGKQAAKWEKNLFQQQEFLDISNEKPGVYIIRISEENKLIENRKITIIN